MKKTIFLPVITAGILLLSSCEQKKEQEEPVQTSVSAATKPDLTQVRSEIVALENQWAAAINAKDINAMMALFADDAVSMQDGAPSLVGKAAIQKKQEIDFAAPAKYASIGFETIDVYAQGDVVTEVGKTMYKDSTGKITGSGKYMAIFEKKDGKYLCIREIYNSDSK